RTAEPTHIVPRTELRGDSTVEFNPGRSLGSVCNGKSNRRFRDAFLDARPNASPLVTGRNEHVAANALDGEPAFAQQPPERRDRETPAVRERQQVVLRQNSSRRVSLEAIWRVQSRAPCRIALAVGHADGEQSGRAESLNCVDDR